MNKAWGSMVDAPQLLVSVRNATEAREVLQTKVAIVDVKEPRHGSLGAADRSVIQEIVSLVQASGRPCCSSAAMGELLEFKAPPVSMRRDDHNGMNPFGNLGYAKFGLAGCEGRENWPEIWQAAWRCLPRSTRRVAVHYVDRRRAASPSWNEVLHYARKAECEVLLCDTFQKDHGGLLDWVTPCELREMGEQVHVAGMKLALAGSLTVSSLEQLPSNCASFYAIRSAACPQGRDGAVSRVAVEQFLDAMQVAWRHRTNPSRSM